MVGSMEEGMHGRQESSEQGSYRERELEGEGENIKTD